MKLTKSQLKEIIREELGNINERTPLEPDEVGSHLTRAVDDLAHYIKKARNIDKWAEKHWRSASKLIDTINTLIKVFGRMK